MKGISKLKKKRLMDTVNSMVNVRGKGQWGEVEGKGRLNGDGRKFGAVNTQYTNDIF